MRVKKVYAFLVHPATVRKLLLVTLCFLSAGLLALVLNSEFERFRDQPAYLALRSKPVRHVFTNETISQSETGGQENHD